MSGPGKHIVIVDIDGTLADVQHRLRYLKGPGKKNWVKFFRSAPEDQPVDIVKRWVNNLAPDYTTILITGRPDEYREDTEAWLAQHAIQYKKLYMRRLGDN